MDKDLFSRIGQLPATEIAEEVNRTLERTTRLIVTAPPGAGKSTVLPLTMLESAAGKGKILMLEPRRIAARQIASRMAWNLGESVGQTVGYRIRFENKVSRNTRIEVVTEGILERRLLDDPVLEGVSAVIFDEFHERSLVCDETLALTRQVQAVLREDLRIIIMSATLETGELAEALDAPVIESAGRLFPVEIRRSREEATAEGVALQVARTILEAHGKEDGDILAFLPGEGEIRRCAEALSSSLGSTMVYPLYGMLPMEKQREAIAPSPAGSRKVVLATSIAETSLTIEGVRIVIDPGFCRKMVYDARSGLSRLETVRISLDMAAQRAGRAGRVAPGTCYRLYSAATERSMAAARKPEILDADLAGTVLSAAAWGEGDITALPWLTPPPAGRVKQARSLLESLGAIDGRGRITEEGRRMAALPCHPRMARMLLMAGTPERKSLAADIAALLEERDPLGESSDAGIGIKLDAMREARKKGSQGRWSRILQSSRQYASLVGAAVDDTPADPFEAGALIAAAYPERIGKAWAQAAGKFLLSGGDIAAPDPSDPLCACEWIAVAGLNARPGGTGRIFLAAPVAPEDLSALATVRDNIFWDSKEGAAVARRESRIGGLLLDSRPLSEGVREEQVRVICEAAAKDGLSMFDFPDEVRNLQCRIAAAASWHPELGLPDVGTEALLASAPQWLPAFIGKATNSSQLKKIDMRAVIWSLLPYDLQQRVDAVAPEAVTVPTGSRIRLEYRNGADAPVLKVRLQECFGLADTPAVDEGRKPVLMELLSPGFKPVQLTSDLRSFWSGTYFEVRKELRRRYPKHSWPDNPLEAEATRRTVRR